MTTTVFVALGLLAAQVQERAVPTFAVQAEVILVDVVVLDRDGKPVRGLTRQDFTVLEDGRPQSVVGFEARDLVAPAGTAGAPGTASAGPSAAPAGRGRTVALILDDLSMDALRMTSVKGAVKSWLDANADPRDDVTLLTTSGDLWWSDTAATGKADLLAVLDRAQGKRPAQSAADYMSDWEAYRIDTYEDATGAGAASSGGTGAGSAGPPSGAGPAGSFGLGNLTNRVATRWAERRSCVGNCKSMVQARAREVLDRSTRRARALFGAIERLSKAMAGARGRKTIVVLSDGLIRDAHANVADRAVDAAQRGNTAVYFADTRGLAGASLFGADQTSAPRPGDVGLMSTEETFLATAGTALVAEETGGSVVRNTNDLLAGVTRMIDESSAYYLLAYEPAKSPDGKWHKLEVKVSRPGSDVRARRRYFASSSPDRKDAPSGVAEKGGNKDKDKEKGDGKLPARPFDPAILTSGDDALPVRVAPYVMEARDALARVMVALEIEVASLALGAGDKRSGKLDLTLMGLSRDQPKTELLDQRLELELDPKAPAGVFTLSRELRMPPGVAQVRVLVRDVATGMTGRASGRFEVPVLSEPYLSTPVLTDKIDKPKDGDPRLIPVAHREFRPAGALFCQYEVHNVSGAKGGTVAGGYRLSSVGGQVVAEAPPTAIAPAKDGRFVRILGFPLDGLPEGEYELVLEVTGAGGRTLSARERFRLAAPAR